MIMAKDGACGAFGRPKRPLGRGSTALKKTILTEKCRCCVFRTTKKKATSPRALSPPPRLIAIFHPKWPSAFPPPRSISVSPYWILTKSRGWGTFGSPIRMSLRTSIGLIWSLHGGGGWHKTISLLNGHSKPWRRTIVLASFRRRRRSCTPPHRDRTSSDGPDCISASDAPL